MKTRTQVVMPRHSMVVLLVAVCGLPVNAFAQDNCCSNQRYTVSSTGQPNPDEDSANGWQSPNYNLNGGVGAAVSYACMDSLYKASCPIHSGYDTWLWGGVARGTQSPSTLRLLSTTAGLAASGVANVTNPLVAVFAFPAYTNSTDCNGNSTGDPVYNDYSSQC